MSKIFLIEVRDVYYIYIKYDVPTTVNIKTMAFWNVAPCRYMGTNVSEEPATSTLRL
jgi:hypothetical protein